MSDAMLRRARAEDADAVGRLLGKMMEEIGPLGPDRLAPEIERAEHLMRTVRGYLDEPQRHLVLLIDPALALLMARLDAPNAVYTPKRLMHVSAVWVEPSARHRGLGRRLVEEAIAWGATHGCSEARLNVLLANPAHALYRELGFTEVQVEMRRPIRA